MKILTNNSRTARNGAILRTAFKLIKNSKICIKRVLKKYAFFQLFQIQCQWESSIDYYTENVGVFAFSSSVFKCQNLKVNTYIFRVNYEHKNEDQ